MESRNTWRTGQSHHLRDALRGLRRTRPEGTAGCAGLAAAIRAAELGYSALMVDRGTLRGTCVNVGCVPSKSLLHTAQTYYRAIHSRFAGVRPRGAALDWNTVIEGKDELADRLRRERYEQALEAYPSVSLVRGEARATPEADVEVDGRIYRPSRVVVANGPTPGPRPSLAWRRPVISPARRRWTLPSSRAR